MYQEMELKTKMTDDPREMTGKAVYDECEAVQTGYDYTNTSTINTRKNAGMDDMKIDSHNTVSDPERTGGGVI